MLPLISQPGSISKQPCGQAETPPIKPETTGAAVANAGAWAGGVNAVGSGSIVLVGVSVGVAVVRPACVADAADARVLLGKGLGNPADAAVAGAFWGAKLGGICVSTKPGMLVGMRPWRCKSAGELTQAARNTDKNRHKHRVRRKILPPAQVLLRASIREFWKNRLAKLI